jgi:hypothetical protein
MSPDQKMTDARHCAPVLERVIDILTEDENVPFGEAIKRAQLELGLAVPDYMEETILILAFKIVVSRKIPGLPEA